MKVLLSGYQGFGNLGDEAIARALVDALQARGHTPMLLSGAPVETRREWGVPAYHRIRGLLPALVTADVVVSGGGGLLQDVTSARSLRYYLGVLRLARWLGTPSVVFGQSIGPLSPSGRRAVARTLRGVPCLVRDEASRDLLNGLGVDASVVPDAALGLALPEEADAAADVERGGVLLVPRSDVPGASVAFAHLAERLVAQGVRVTTLPLDQPADSEEADALARRPGVTRLEANDPREVLSLVAAADLVVSVRLHGLILAARMGVPHVGVGYDPKVAGFTRTTGAPLLPVPVDADDLLAVVERTLDEATRLRAEASERSRVLLQETEAGFDALDAAIRACVGG